MVDHEQDLGKTEVSINEFAEKIPELSDKPEYLAFGLMAAGVPITIKTELVTDYNLTEAKRIALEIALRVKRDKQIHLKDAERSSRRHKEHKIKDSEGLKEYERLKKRRQRANKRKSSEV